MIILIGGESHTGKTFLAQRLLERYSFPYFSLDHLKMGLIRGLADCGFTAESPDALISEKMWRISTTLSTPVFHCFSGVFPLLHKPTASTTVSTKNNSLYTLLEGTHTQTTQKGSYQQS